MARVFEDEEYHPRSFTARLKAFLNGVPEVCCDCEMIELRTETLYRRRYSNGKVTSWRCQRHTKEEDNRQRDFVIQQLSTPTSSKVPVLVESLPRPDSTEVRGISLGKRMRLPEDRSTTLMKPPKAKRKREEYFV
jgi:hypothetical protein